MRRPIAIAATACVLAAPAAAVAKAAPSLAYGPARTAIQRKADRFAEASTQITALFRLGALRYSGSAKWQRINPTGCASCGWDPTTESSYDTAEREFCSVTIIATRKPSGRVGVRVDDFACF